MHPYHVALATTSPGDIALSSDLRQSGVSVPGVAIFTVERLFSLLDQMPHPDRDEAVELYYDAYLSRDQYFFDLVENEAQVARYQALRRHLVEMWQNQSFESVAVHSFVSGVLAYLSYKSRPDGHRFHVTLFQQLASEMAPLAEQEDVEVSTGAAKTRETAQECLLHETEALFRYERIYKLFCEQVVRTMLPGEQSVSNAEQVNAVSLS